MSFGKAILIGLMLFCLVPAAAHAGIKSCRQLTTEDKTMLEASEQRLAQLDHSLMQLEKRHAAGKISTRDYGYLKRDLIVFIGHEAQFQDDILIKPRLDIPEMLKRAAEYAAGGIVLVGEVAGYIICRCPAVLGLALPH